MFYSHELLTSRKYGVATIWLVATLGQSSTLRKVSKKAILEVNVEKACGTIMTPEAPMALRLQSALLIGVTRVFSQQCGYVLHDVQASYNSIRQLLAPPARVNVDTDPRANLADLTIKENEHFDNQMIIPTLDLDSMLREQMALDAALLDSQFVSSQQANHSNLLHIPSETSIMSDAPLHTVRQSSALPMAGNATDEDISRVDWAVDGAGGLILDILPQHATNPPQTPLNKRVSHMDSDASAQVRREHEHIMSEGFRAIEDFDMDLPTFGEPIDLRDVPDSSSLSPLRNPDTTFVLSNESEQVVTVPHRSTRAPNPILDDRTIELRSRETQQNSANYFQTMAAALKEHLHRRLPHQAKKNAEHFIYGRGLNGIGNMLLPHMNMSSSLAMFAGERLHEWIFGPHIDPSPPAPPPPPPLTARKRHSSESDSDSQRRVRPRNEANELQLNSFDDNSAFLRMDEDIEVGRQMESELDDISSAMPWAISASKRGSSVSRAGGVSLGVAGSATAATGYTRSGLVSASPSQGRRGARTTLATLEDLGSGGFHDIDDPAPKNMGPISSDPVARERAEGIEAALDKDSKEVLWFIEDGISSKKIDTLEADAGQAAASQVGSIDSITLEELMPSEIHRKKAVAMGFLVLMSLATKNLVRVEQAEHFGDITISVI